MRNKHWTRTRMEPEGEKDRRNLKKDCCGGSRNMQLNMERALEVGGRQSQMEIFTDGLCSDGTTRCTTTTIAATATFHKKTFVQERSFLSHF